MSLTTPIYQETALAGRIVASNVIASSTTIYASFEDKKTGDAREPQAETLYFVLSKDTENFEIIKASSHSTTSGVTTITVDTNGRALNKYGAVSGSSSGNKHPVNSEIGCADIHLPVEVLNDIVTGAEGTSGTAFRIGDETNSDIYLYAQNADTNKPFLFYDASENKWMYSNNGTDTAAIGGSTASYTSGDGIDITAGVIALDLKADSGLEISSTELAVKLVATGGIDVGATGLVLDLSEAGYTAGALATVISDVTTSATELNQLDGISANVTDTNLNTLTAGSASDASALHTHTTLGGVVSLTAGETIAVGETIYIKGITSTTLEADNDCWLKEATPNAVTNGTTMQVTRPNAAGSIERSLVHFDISGSPASVTKAYLKLYAATNFSINAPAGDKIQVSQLTGAFDETTATWNNQPGIDSGTTVACPYDVRHNYPAGAGIYFDVTDIYNSSWDTNNYGLGIRWDDETPTGGGNNITYFGTRTNGTTARRPDLILLTKDGDYGKVFVCSDAATVAGFRGIALSGGDADDTITVQITGVYSGASGLTPFSPYKASTSGGFSAATNSLDAQMLALNATEIMIKDKRKEYSSDVFGTQQTIGDLDMSLTTLPAGLLLDNITNTAAVDSLTYSQDGYVVAIPDDNGVTTRDTGMATVDVL